MLLSHEVHCLSNDISDKADYMKYLFLSTINKINLKGKECYLIKIDNTEMFIDALTGIRVNFIDNNLNITVDDCYEFGTVSDNNVIKPIISDY